MNKFLLTVLAAFVSVSSYSQDTWEVGSTTLTEYDLVTGVQVPWEILWGPDDYIWATERRGRVLRIDPATGNYTTVLDLTNLIPNNGSGEPGMLGMAAHPDWANEPKMFIVYNTGGGWNVSEQLSSFEWNGSELVNEEVILDNIPGGGIHNGSRILILPDNTLMMTTGDTGDGGASSQDENDIAGKVLRMNLDGTIPADNPDPTSLVYSMGHRNSQGLCLGPNGLIYSSEHGQSTNDEFNIIEPGRNYGWPDVEGFCDQAGEAGPCADLDVREPLQVWSPCIAVNGIEYYNHPAIPEWQNSVLMAVLGGLGANYERLSVLHMSDDGTAIESEDQFFSEFNQRVRDVCVNPYTGAVYVALNGPSYPGQGPNIIKEFVNEDYLSVEEQPVLGQNVKLYPNPVQDNLNIEFTDDFLGASFHLISFTGQIIERFVIAENRVVLPVTDLPAGKYYISATSGSGTITKTFIVK
ncbi:PQQ-dependent sugar dehydrogenase [Sanyastnella coralliicola]|uniref:PQQ-dependent sugar dehydrogenase n=1 Tax=Sanyastnella coralliicola TaxID=3069118 RepID=UPI0027BB08ED|nr:PQQ-dependent sugar dehydrogenase [Longitalea sp. SCSIO 12813]